MEAFQEQVLQRLSRIENAVEVLIDRLSKLEVTVTQADGDLWEELRTTAKDCSKTCDQKRKAIHEIMQDRNDRLEKRLKEELEDLEEKLKIFEQKVFSVEKVINAGETTTRDVVSLQGRLESLSSCVTQNKVHIGAIEAGVGNQNVRLAALENRFEDRGKHWPTIILSIFSTLIALGALLFMVLKEVLTKK